VPQKVALVTGAARGLGLEMCRQLLAEDWRVIACPRVEEEGELAALVPRFKARLHIVTMDVGDEDSIQQAAKSVASRTDRIEVLINNAGVYPKIGSVASGIDSSEMIRAFQINTLGPMHVITALLPLLRNGRKKILAQITSKMGSIDDNSSGGSYAYRVSKSALNMVGMNLSHEFGPEGFTVLTIHPGWVQTRMGTDAAPLGLKEGAADVLKTILTATPEDNGAFIGPGQERVPW
jgi:NAD(P)-dependent dehydrogenase (short-subunit alcohol dehydrogenase family)